MTNKQCSENCLVPCAQLSQQSQFYCPLETTLQQCQSFCPSTRTCVQTAIDFSSVEYGYECGPVTKSSDQQTLIAFFSIGVLACIIEVIVLSILCICNCNVKKITNMKMKTIINKNNDNIKNADSNQQNGESETTISADLTVSSLRLTEKQFSPVADYSDSDKIATEDSIDITKSVVDIQQ